MHWGPKMRALLHFATLAIIIYLCVGITYTRAKVILVKPPDEEWFFFGAMQARCHMQGYRLLVPDSPSKSNEVLGLSNDKVSFIGLVYTFFVAADAHNGQNVYLDHNNVSLQTPYGGVVGTGGFFADYPFVKGPAWSPFTTSIVGDRKTFYYQGTYFEENIMHGVSRGLWASYSGFTGTGNYYVACEDVPTGAPDLGLRIITPTNSVFCVADYLSLFDRVCGSQNMRLVQPDTGLKDLSVLTAILKRHDALDPTESGRDDVYYIGASWRPSDQTWRYHDMDELPNGQMFGKGFARSRGYIYQGLDDTPGVYNGWGRHHWTKILAPFTFWPTSYRVNIVIQHQTQGESRSSGWRNHPFYDCPTRPAHVICEKLPSGVTLPQSGFFFVENLQDGGVSNVFAQCRATNPSSRPAILDTVSKQVELERVIMSKITVDGNDADIRAKMDVDYVIGGVYAGRKGKYPIGAGNDEGDWMWYATNAKMQTGFSNAGGAVTYTKWIANQPALTTATGANGNFINSIYFKYNMKSVGWLSSNTVRGLTLVCENAGATSIQEIRLVAAPDGVAHGALSQLCSVNSAIPFDPTSAKLQEDLVITVGKSAGASDVILLGGRYTSNEYPPNRANGEWKHASGDVFMTGLALTTGASTTEYQSWALGTQPASVPRGDQEAGLALGYQQSAGGWITVAVDTPGAKYVACVPPSGSSSESPAMTLSKTLQFVTDSDRFATPDTYTYADARCILNDPTARSLPVTSATVQAALEMAALTNPSVVTADSLVLLPGSYKASVDAWLWVTSGSAFTNQFSLEDGVSVDVLSQYQNWAVGFPRKSDGRNAVWFSLSSGGWVNSESVASGPRLVVCESGHDSFDMGDFAPVTVTAPAGAATLADYPDQASILCEANTPSGVPHVITDDSGFRLFELYFLKKMRDGQLPSAVTVIATNTRYSEAVEANLNVPWAAGYPKSPETEEMLLAYDLSLKGFVNIPASTAEVTLACDVNGKDFASTITIVHSDDYSSAGITAPNDSDETLIQVCALKDPGLAPVEVVYDGRQYELLVLQMRAALDGNDPYSITEPLLTGGRYVGGVWAWNNDANKNFATGLSGTAIRDSYIHWPSNFQNSADNTILASDATTGYWSSIAGDSASFFVACMPASLASTYSYVVTAPPGLPAPNSPRNMSAALCMMNDPPGYPLIANDELTQRGLGESVRFALSQQIVTADTNVLLVRASVTSTGETTWDTGAALNDIYTKWAPGNPDPDPALTMLAFSTSLGQWVNTDPSVPGTPYSLACETGGGDGSDGSSSLFKIGVFLVAVESTRSGRSSATVKADRDVAAGWAACAAHSGAPVQVLNATVDLEVQSIVIKELLNTSSTILSDASTPVLLGAYRDSASGEWGWVDPMQLTDLLTPFDYTNWVSEPAAGDDYAFFILSDGQWTSHDGAVSPTVAACVPYNYGLVVSPKPPVNGGGGGGTGGGGDGGGTGTGGDENGGSGGGNDPETGTDWSDPFAVCNLTGGVPLRVWNENVQNALESSATSPDMPDVIQLGGEFAGDSFSGAWQWMVKSSDTGHGPAFTQNYALDSDPAAVLIDGAYAKWAPGYPKLTDAAETAPSASLLAYSKSAGGWVNVNPADGPYQVICTLSQGPDDGYIAYSPKNKESKGFPWWIILIVVLVVLALLAVLIIVLCCCCRKKKAKNEHALIEVNDKLPEASDKDIYFPPRDSDVPVANPLSPYVPADVASSAKVREKRTRQKRSKPRHAGTEIVDVNTDFMDQNTEIREDENAAIFSPAEDTWATGRMLQGDEHVDIPVMA